MTAIDRIKCAIESAQEESRDYIVRILETIGLVPDETVPEVCPSVQAALQEARRKVREVKTERGIRPGADTALADKNEMRKNLEEYEREHGGG